MDGFLSVHPEKAATLTSWEPSLLDAIRETNAMIQFK
jgi:hypothetical protein